MHIWFKSIIHHIQDTCKLSSIKGKTIILYNDNDAYIVQVKIGCIKNDRNKYILSKFFYTHELKKNDDINVQKI